jgi:RNA polymerase sigma factor (sigma-70 family)
MREHANLPVRASWRHFEFRLWPGSVDRADLEQIAAIELWTQARKFDATKDDEQFVRFVQTAMNCRIIDYRRAIMGRNGQLIHVNCAGELPQNLDELGASENVSFEQVDAIRQLVTRIRLTERQECVVSLLLADLTPPEISRELGVTVQSVHATIRRVSERLAPHRHLIN